MSPKLIFHSVILFLIFLLCLFMLIGWGSYEFNRGKEFILSTDKTLNLYNSGRTLCRDQGNDWECRPGFVKGREVFWRGELVQP
jgi:hypothetical protein